MACVLVLPCLSEPEIFCVALEVENSRLVNTG